MPLRGILLPLEHSYFGFVDRLYVYLHVSKITHLQNVGLSLHQVADELNKYGSRAMNGVPWNVQNVISVLQRDEQIKRTDACLLKRKKSLRWDILANDRCPLYRRHSTATNRLWPPGGIQKKWGGQNTDRPSSRKMSWTK